MVMLMWDKYEECYKKVIDVEDIKKKIEEINIAIDKLIDISKGGLDEEFIKKGGKLKAQKDILQSLIKEE